MKKCLLLIIFIPTLLYANANWDDIWKTKYIEKKTKDDKKWFYRLGGKLENKDGNTKSLTSGGSTEIKYFDGVLTSKIGFSFTYKEDYDKITNEKFSSENKGNGNINFDYFIFKRFEIFIFSLHEYDRGSNLIYRNYTGGGPKLVLFNNDYLEMDISYAPTFKYEDYLERNIVNTIVHSFRYRIDIFLLKKLKYQFFCYYIPLYDFSEYRFIFETSFNIDVIDLKWTKKSGVGLKIGYRREYNSGVPEGIKKTDSIIFSNVEFFI